MKSQKRGFMTDKQIIHGEQVPLITLTRQQLEEDWFTLWELYKAKEQECEKLRFPMPDTNYAILTKEEFEQLNQLKEENEELRKFQKLLEEQMKFNKSELELSLSSEIKRSEFLLKEFKKVDKQKDNWREQAEKLEQILTEIKEIADTCNSGVICSECPYTEECKTDTEAEALGVCKLIKQKCEVLDEDTTS